MHAHRSMKTKVELYIGGCSGSNIPQAERIFREDDSAQHIISRPVSRSAFGTHTTSLALVMGQTGILFDNGSGAGQACEFLKAHLVNNVYIFQTHYHHDHLSGLMVNPFLLFDARHLKGMYGPTLGNDDIVTVLDKYYTTPFWPISPKALGIKLPLFSFKPGDTIPVLGGVRTLGLNHAGGAVAYRIKTPAGDVVIATDNELSQDCKFDIQQQTAEFMAGAALAYVDVQYTDDEYNGKGVIGPGNTNVSRKNWGHSTPSMLVQTFEQMVSAPKLTLVGHHDPKRSDEGLFDFQRLLKAHIEHLGTKVRFARECETIELPVTVPPQVAEEVASI